MKFTKSKARNFAKNRWSVTKLTLDMKVMVTDLHAKIQVDIYKDLEKSWENCWSLKFTKSKARDFAKNQFSIMKLTLNLQVMVTGLHAKNQVNIYKRLEKKSGKLFDH